MQQKFSNAQVAMLRGNLRASRLDSFQLAEAVKMFFTTHGYGISPETAREVALRLEIKNGNVESFRRQLEMLALVV